MAPAFHPRLVNDPFGDPGVFVPFSHQKKAILFDLGEISRLSPRDILKIRHVFVSHTHMDHFIGFDHLLRLVLGRDKKITLYGPEGFLENVAAKLKAYTWDLVEKYENTLILEAVEIRPPDTLRQTYVLQSRFCPQGPPRRKAFTGCILPAPDCSVHATVFSHGIPCLGFRLKERFHVSIRKEVINQMGLLPGPWLTRLKTALYEKQPMESPFTIPADSSPSGPLTLDLGTLTGQIARITNGKEIGYITDIPANADNLARLIPFVREVDHLFIEAAFLDTERDVAFQKNHLTARQAGEICRKANVGRYTLFHFSPRYMDVPQRLYEEAAQAFGRAIKNRP